MSSSWKNRFIPITRIKQLAHVLPPRERAIFSLLIALFTFSLIGVLVGGFLEITTAAPRSGGTYREGIVGRPRMINPLYAPNNAVDKDLVALTYAGLIRYNGTELVPDLAKDWTISDDQKTYTFILRDDVFWPDGKAFNANDVVYTINTAQNPQYQSPLLSNFTGISVEADDEHTVTFTLPKPLAPFLETLTVGILPKHIWENIPPEAVGLTDFNIQPMGLGPYQFKQLSKTKFGTIHSYELSRNDLYHNGEPYIKTLILRFYTDQVAALDGLEHNEVDGLHFLPTHILENVKSKSTTIHPLQLPQYTALFFNLSSNSPINDQVVRKALSHAIDKEQLLNEAVQGEGNVVHGPILEGYPGYHENIETFGLDVSHAHSLLDEAGWEQAEDGKRKDADGTILSLRITTSNTPELIRAAEFVQHAWQDLGVTTEIQVIDSASIQSESISPRKFDILLFGEIVGLDPDPFPFWHSSQISTQGLNLSNFKNSDADTVLEEARSISDPVKKAEKYIHFQNILVAQIPAVFLYSPHYLYPIDESITRTEYDQIITPSDRFANIHKWYIKTKRVLK